MNYYEEVYAIDTLIYFIKYFIIIHMHYLFQICQNRIFFFNAQFKNFYHASSDLSLNYAPNDNFQTVFRKKHYLSNIKRYFKNLKIKSEYLWN